MQDIYYFCIHIIIYISMKLSNKTIISIFIALTYIINLFAQGYEGELTSKRLSASDGLLSNTIRAMVQDNTGYIWHLELVNLMVARDLGTRDVTLYFFEHEIRRRPTDRREVIIRITRMFFCTLEHEIFLNTNNSNNTNIFLHT